MIQKDGFMFHFTSRLEAYAVYESSIAFCSRCEDVNNREMERLTPGTEAEHLLSAVLFSE